LGTAAAAFPTPAAVIAPDARNASSPAMILRSDGGILAADGVLDIDDSEDDEYYEDEEEEQRRGPLSGAKFIILLFVLLVLQLVFIGFLVNQGIINPSALFGG
jgi:hypothetical protein